MSSMVSIFFHCYHTIMHVLASNLTYFCKNWLSHLQPAQQSRHLVFQHSCANLVVRRLIFQICHSDTSTMPREDGLPSYEEATGIQRILPQNISRQVSRRVNKDDNSGSCSPGCLYPILACAPVLILGILMIIIGQPNIFNCPHSWLPVWLVGGGIIILIFYALCLLFSLRFCINKGGAQGEPQTEEGARSMAWVIFLIYGDILAGLIWYVAGCYWTWRSVDAMLFINRKIWYGYSEAAWWPQAEGKACNDGPVLWFSFFATIFPFLYVVFFCLCCCWRCMREDRGGGGGSHGQEPQLEEGGGK